LGVITVMSTVPVPVAAGLMAVISVSEAAVIVALTPPKSTVVASLNPLPVIVTLVPPAAGPLAGEIAVTCGGVAGDVEGDEVADMLTGPVIP
jgi:hypothetical protein